MINRVVEVGRITKAPELRKTKNNKSVVFFTLAVNRTKDVTDFIPCVAWEKTAEYLCEYGYKGALLSVEGKNYTSTYEHKGEKITKMEVNCDHIDILSRKEKEEEPIEEPSFFNRDEVKTDDVFISKEELPFY